MPEPRQLVWAPKAEDDLINIWHYYARVGSPRLLTRFCETSDKLPSEWPGSHFFLGAPARP